MRSMTLALLMALFVTGCTAQAARDPAPTAASSASTTQASLDGTEWRFVEVNGTAVPGDVNATLRLQGNRASGRSGCNAYGASFETGADGSAKFGQAMSTRMACLKPAGAMEVERGVLGALQHTARIERHASSLTLLDASGKPLAKLQRQTP